MTTSWWWVRHGPTHANGLVGHLDIPADLSDLDRLTAVDTALPDDAMVISSDLIRATATADAIVSGRKRLRHSSALREMDYGDWDGKAFEEISRTDPVLSMDFWNNPGAVSPPQGESWDKFSQRIHREIALISDRHSTDNIIVVAHFGVILAALQLATGMPAKSVFSFKVDNLSISRFDYLHKSAAWRVDSINT